MARIRTIKPDFFRHEGLFELEKETGLPLRVAFAGLWTAADREGRFKWRPRQLKLDALPFDEIDFSRVLDALTTRGHIVKYVVNGEEFGFIPSWNDHQVINNREAASDLPEPTKESIESSTSTREARVNNATATPLVHAPVEGKGKEGKGKEDASFDAFWSAYPKKKAKDDALKAFSKRKPDAELLSRMLSAIKAQSASEDWLKDGGKFIPYPATWLNDARWEDEETAIAAPSSSVASVAKTDDYLKERKEQEAKATKPPQFILDQLKGVAKPVNKEAA